MVKKRILAGEGVSVLPEPSKLHKINTEKVIKDICDRVISAIETNRLSRVDPKKLIKDARKIAEKPNKTRKNNIFCSMSDIEQIEINRNSARLRTDWTQESFENKKIRGYIFYDTDGSPLGFTYTHQDRPDDEYVFLDKNILQNTLIAADIIIELSKTYQKVWRKTHHK